jgi:hypothetical protein
MTNSYFPIIDVWHKMLKPSTGASKNLLLPNDEIQPCSNFLNSQILAGCHYFKSANRQTQF